ncbi:MAG: CpaF family protein [Planctomycetota bacterium]|jgi:pilus assembly protein CpaF
MADRNDNVSPVGAAESSTTFEEIKTSVHRALLQTMNLLEARRMSLEELHAECSRRVDTLLSQQQRPLSGPEKNRLIHELMDEIFGLGPLEEFLRDETISDILVNGPHQIYIEREGVLSKSTARFRDDQHMVQVIQRIASQVGRRIDESSPMLDARLVTDGSRVNAIIPPLALDGPSLSIRRFGTVPIDVDGLISRNTLTAEMASFMQTCVKCKMNILISGGTGSGKTTMLNVMSRWIPEGERVITIEDAAELQLQREHVVRLETRPANIEGEGEVVQRDLLRNSLRMRPDRIIIGEVRGAEALDMLQAMNTGHEGSMTTVHANNPRDALSRVENMVSMAGLNFPVAAIRQQTSSALDLLVHLSRVTGGRRKLITISEITGMEGDVICLVDLFHFKQTGIDDQGHAMGFFEVSGVRPKLLDRLEAEGIEFPQGMFMKRRLE